MKNKYYKTSISEKNYKTTTALDSDNPNKYVPSVNSEEDMVFEFKRNDSIEKIINYENYLLNLPKRNFTFQDLGKKFCIVISSYNNEKFITPNINSVLIQTYNNWKIIYIDDASSDKTLEIAYQMRSDWNISAERFEIFSHPHKRTSPAYSYYIAAHNYCNDDDIMVQLDGDDMLAGENVLSKLAHVYDNNNIWVTFGSFLSTEGTIRIDANKHNISKCLENIRNSTWITSHLRTSYTWLFKRIKEQDLKYENNFLNCANDVAIMFPIIEMAGKDRTHYMKDIIHLYRLHPNNIFLKDRKLQIKIEKHLKSQPHYSLLPENFSYKKSIDTVYVINLDQATKRWNITSDLLAKEGITHQRFRATYGYDIKVIDLESNETFFGLDLKDNIRKIEKGKKYRIICEPNNKNSIEFNFRGYINFNKSPVSSGELGCWCSTRRIWEDIYENNYKKVIIFEDDIIPISNFKFHLENYLNYLPEKFDIGYLAITIAKGVSEPFYTLNDHVLGFNKHARGWGGFGYIITDNAVKKLRNLDEVSFPTDIFYWCLSKSKMPIIHHSKDCQRYNEQLENYASSLRLVEVRRVMDEHCINNMGRNQTKIELKVPQKIYFISNNDILYQEAEIGGKKINSSYFAVRNGEFISSKIINDEKESEYYEITCSPEVLFKIQSDFVVNSSFLERLGSGCCLAKILIDAKQNNFTNILILKDNITIPENEIATAIHNLIEYTDHLSYFDTNFNNIDNASYGMFLKEYDHINGDLIDLTDFSNFIF